MGRFEEGMEGMAETFIFETSSLLENLDQILMRTESAQSFTEEDINEIFRCMHTIKGSSAMMGLENMSKLSHAVEDMFFIIREDKPVIPEIKKLYELVFKASDLLKEEVEAIGQEEYTPSDFSEFNNKIKAYVAEIKGSEGKTPVAEKKEANKPAEIVEIVDGETAIRVDFEPDCKMENIRAMLLIRTIKDLCSKISYEPSDLENDENAAVKIIDNGFIVKFVSKTSEEDVIKASKNALNVRKVTKLEEKKKETVKTAAQLKQQINKNVEAAKTSTASVKSNLMSVSLNKLDALMDLVGEIVITESMVTSNPDLKGLKLDRFNKAARELNKLINELQDVVMSVRMVPVEGAFSKMTRIVRDMKVKLNRDVQLVMKGEDTEVDKTIVDNLNDPLMHMVRNSIDHGIEENVEERINAGKPAIGTVTLSARSESGEVIITVKDDGRGMDREKILDKAEKNGILKKPREQYTDKEAYSLVMLPGFSTNESVTEFSGRGVGMDVVKKNIEKLGGNVKVESKLGEGSVFTIRIPLSLAILDGMEVRVGESIFTVPVNTIRESFKFLPKQLVKDIDGKEMVMLRGECLPVIRLHKIFEIETEVTDLNDGILMEVESDNKKACIFVDKLIGQQQIVTKPFSSLLTQYNVKEKGMSGCSILGDGSITIILDINNIINNY